MNSRGSGKSSTAEKTDNPLYEFKAKLSMKEMIPMGVQHFAASVVGIVTPAIIIAEQSGLDDKSKTILLQLSLIISGLGTLLQLLGLFRFGAKMPIVIGTSFAFLATMRAIVSDYISINPTDSEGAIAVILGAQLAGGIAAIFVGLFVKQIRKLFPAHVTGTVILAIGISLFSTAVSNMAGGSGSVYFGCWQPWTVSVFTLLVVTFFNYFTKGACRLASILFGMIAGYLLALLYTQMGVAELISFSSIGEAKWIQLVTPMHFGIKFVPSAIISMVIMYVVNAAQAIGDFSSTTMFGMDREPTTEELSGGIMANGLMGVIGAFFGGLPSGTFSQNVGIVTATRVINRMVLVFAAILMILAGVFPKVSAAITTIPDCVIGGVTLSIFASIATNGIRMIASAGINIRNMGVVGLSIALGMGITQVSGSLEGFPSWIINVFGSSAVAVSALLAIVLNLVLPKSENL